MPLTYIVPVHWLLTLNRSLFQLFPLLCCLLTRLMICAVSAVHVPEVLSYLDTSSVLAGEFEQVTVPVLLFSSTVCYNWTLVCSISAALGHWDFLAV